MSFKRVDIETPVEVDGYSFEDADGCIFAVCFPQDTDSVITIITDGEHHFDMWKRDIPMFIKALQAAYDHK